MTSPMKTKISKSLFLLAAILICLVIVGNKITVRSANLAEVSVTLSNSRPSFHGVLAAGNTVGSSQVIITTTAASWPSTTSAQLVEGDTLLIGNSSTMTQYDVTDVISDSTVNITKTAGGGPLESGDTEAGDDVVATSSATMTVRFTTANAITDGSFRILLPAETDDTAAADGIPDGGYFDYGTSAPTVTCPADIAGYNFSAGTSAASSVTIAGVDYNVYTCPYVGAGAIGTAFDGTTNDAMVISSVINPAPKKASHVVGYADTFRPIIQHLNSGGTVADYTTVSIGLVEAVRVTAEVAPQITFRIIGVDSGTTACGESTSVTTTPATVPFGELAISAFTHAAQALSVSTNAVNGYVVTAIANDQLGRNGGTCTGDNTGASCIPDSVGDASSMAHAVSDEWSSTSVKGFAYSLDEVNATNAEPAFEYDNNATCTDAVDGGTCTACDGTGDCFRQFADAEDSQSVVRVMGSVGDTVADNDNLYVCYRAIISATQAAGDYENYLTYTATATF